MNPGTRRIPKADEPKYILDFRKWKTKAFGAQFDKLLKGLKIYYEKPNEGRRDG